MTAIPDTRPDERSRLSPLVLAATLLGLVVVPVILYVVMLQYFWSRGELGIDFTQTLLPAAEEIASGRSPYPAYGYPPLVAFALLPFTVVPFPELVHTAMLLGGIAASLAVLGIRDWRCYGAAFLWGASFHAVQTGNVSVWLLLSAALAWRFRNSSMRSGVAAGLGIATKIICWPLLIWLASTKRWRTASVATLTALGTTIVLWGSLGFSGLLDYPSSLRGLESAQAPESYTVRAVFIDAGASPALGQIAWGLLALAVVAGCVVAGRRGDDRLSFALAIVACVVASPIVWLHSFALLLAPVAVYRPRFDWVWLLPAALWFGSGSGNGAPWQTVLVLAVAGATLAFALGSSRRVSDAV